MVSDRTIAMQQIVSNDNESKVNQKDVALYRLMICDNVYRNSTFRRRFKNLLSNSVLFALNKNDPSFT